MHVRVKLFAMLREKADAAALMLDLPDGASAADAVAALCEQFPALRAQAERSACAVRLTYVPRETRLHDGDELALIPPVSGG